MTDTLKVLHDMEYLHRDVKPGNMCVGLTQATIRRIYLLDFGLARHFKEKGKVKRRGHVGFRGTLRYVSLNVHERRDQCTCDDLISNFYSMAELSEGSLPWTRLRDPEDIARRKRNTSFEELFPLVKFSGMCTELQEYYTYCYDNVEDPNQPNYEFLKDTIKKCFPAGFDPNTPMPWESKVVEVTAAVSQDGEYAEHPEAPK
ncbi:CK1/TTBKL protein kinase [Trichostrongylus colubriformis]|uniref:non-specific serine/threonine protein kinase n=1 Tax=Trichostrongylus colubriformis TaxID=6319 RepID=A0AAN8F0W5_TRICO